MGGGNEIPSPEWEDNEAVAAQIFQLCDTVGYGSVGDGDKAELESDYAAFDALLSSLGESLPFVVAKCAAHEETVLRTRKLAQRYKNLEVSTNCHLDGTKLLTQGLLALLPAPTPSSSSSTVSAPPPPTLPLSFSSSDASSHPSFLLSDPEFSSSSSSSFPSALSSLSSTRGSILEEALRLNISSVREAVGAAVSRMRSKAKVLTATAAAHRAVGKDMDAVTAKAATIIRDPRNGDVGFKAAPILGATAAGSLGLILLRGALGPVGTIALVGLGALGASEYTNTSIVPYVRAAFQTVYDESAQVSSLIDSKAAALDVVASQLLGAATILQQILEIPPNGSTVSGEELSARLRELFGCLSMLLLRCFNCRDRLTAFMALSFKAQPHIVKLQQARGLMAGGSPCRGDDSAKESQKSRKAKV